MYKVVSFALTLWAIWDLRAPGGARWIGSPMVLNRPFASSSLVSSWTEATVGMAADPHGHELLYMVELCIDTRDLRLSAAPPILAPSLDVLQSGFRDMRLSVAPPIRVTLIATSLRLSAAPPAGK
eukprot:1891391-Pyramimonas_sp.AAC.1